MEQIEASPGGRTGDDRAARSGRVVVALVVGLLVLVVAYFGLGMPRMDHGTSTEADHETVGDDHQP